MTRYCIGVDIGSVSTAVLALTEDTDLIAFECVFDTGPSAEDAARTAVAALRHKSSIDVQDIASTVGTGFGRHSVLDAADTISEISCHARGLVYDYPDTATVIDIGGQDSKVIRLDARGSVVSFAMNDRCAAGTGRFIETMARALGSDLGALNQAARAASLTPTEISSTCAVFAESEIVSLMSRNVAVPDIMAAVFRAIVKRTLGMLRRVGATPPYAMTGGVALNAALVAEFERFLGARVRVPANPQVVGALGAALFARDIVRTAAAARAQVVAPVQNLAGVDLSLDPSVSTTHRFATEDAFLAVLCSSFPREILHALGLPNRLVGTDATSDTAARCDIHAHMCSVALAETNHLSQLAHANRLLGVIAVDACDSKRRVYDYMRQQSPELPLFLSPMPLRNGNADVCFLAQAWRSLVDALCQQFGRSYSDEALWSAIFASNKVRLALQQIMQRWQRGTLDLQGTSLNELLCWAQSETPSSVLARVGSLLERPETRRANGPRMRVALTGNCAGTGTLERLLGASTNLVVLDHCFGMRPWEGEVSSDHTDPFSALAQHTLTTMHCPRGLEKQARLRALLRQVLQAEVDGVVGVHPKFCTPQSVDMRWLLSEIERLGIATLYLELSGEQESDGQLQTRYDAWVETAGQRASRP